MAHLGGFFSLNTGNLPPMTDSTTDPISFSKFLADLDVRKMGARRKEVDWDLFDKLCFIQCAKREIAAFFCMDEDTLAKRVQEKYNTTFSAVFKIKRGAGNISLRRAQWINALEGSTVMQIWLDKKYMEGGEVDKPLPAQVNIDKIQLEIVEATPESQQEKLKVKNDFQDDES